MIFSLKNINGFLRYVKNPIEKSRIHGTTKTIKYKLLRSISIKLSNKMIIKIEKGFIWDDASVPKFLQCFMSTVNDAEIAYLIHDYLYENRYELGISKSFADKEMYLWCKATNNTKNWSFKRIDNYLRYLAVKWFGRKQWND